MIVVSDDQFCTNGPMIRAAGLCELCRRGFCRACSFDLDRDADEVTQEKLRLLMLGSLPHIICGGCFGMITFLFGDCLEGVSSRTDVNIIMEEVFKNLKYFRLDPNRVDHYNSVCRVLGEVVVPIS